MFISTMGEEANRLTRVVTQEQMDPETTKVVMAAYKEAMNSFTDNSEAAFWAARSGCFDAMNAARILRIITSDNPSQDILNEKTRMSQAMADFRERSPYDDGGHHASNVGDASDILERAFTEAIKITDARIFCVYALMVWSILNSIRETEGLPKK